MKKLRDLEAEILQLENELTQKRQHFKELQDQLEKKSFRDNNFEATKADANNTHPPVQTDLQIIIDAFPEPIMIINRDYSVAMANQAVWGPFPNSHQNKCPTCYQLTHKRDKPCSGTDHPCPVRNVFKTGTSTKVQHLHYDYNGHEIHVEIIAAPIFNQNGDVVQVIESSRDITDRQRNEVKISNQLEFMKTLIETIPSPIFYKDKKGVYLGCNSAFEKFLGLPKEKIIGKTVYDIAPRELADRYHTADCALMESRDVQIYEAQVQFSDGSTHDVVFNKASFQKGDGTVGGLVGVMVDITEAKHTAKALEESVSTFNAFMDNLPALAFVKDQDGKYIYLNRAVESFYNQVVEQRLGKTDKDLWPTEIADKIIENDRKVLESKQILRTQEIIELEGNSRYHFVVKFPITNENQQALLAGVAFDITDWRTAEKEKEALQQKLANSHRMEALGTLAGGIAHDFNNILTSILGYVDLALLKSEENSELHKYLTRVLAASHRAKDLVKQILAFSHQSDDKPCPVILKPVVEEALKLISASLPKTIKLEQDILSEDATIIDPTNLHQIVINLCTNASYAMKNDGGRLRVSLSKVEIRPDDVQHHIDLAAGHYVKLSVEDTGSGISPENLEHIFEPFYSTKPKDKGSGMGLSVVHGIVKSCNGTIHVKSTVGEGSCFEVYLPKIEIELSKKFLNYEPLPVGNERILFVDDEIMQTELAEESLGQLGYVVTTFSESSKALENFRNNPECCDLVITDMTMPGMTGDVLGRQIKSIRPDLPIIIYSGYSENFDEDRAKKHGFSGFILKPLIVRDLAVLIRKILDKKGRGGNHAIIGKST